MAAINRKLNLVIPVETDRGDIYVHSTPISRVVFNQYYAEIARTFARIHGGGVSIYAGPWVAASSLETCARDAGTWEGEAGVERGLLGEIRRLTMVVAPGERGWQTVLIDDALRAGVITDDDVAEIMNIVVFFIVASSMHNRRDLPAMLDGASKLWGGSTT